ncbi:MAG TPA: ABC transporter ATP-binding protein [Anaerolineae bacterium]|nr:ABC transporter ATP-binding protein [Anaerolineae bacterium]
MSSSNQFIIEADQLTKKYKDFTAVAPLSFNVERGDIFGLLGPNGAGKTTTIAMLLGLIRPTAGSVTIAGHNMRHQAPQALRQVGAFVEPAFYPYLSGRDNLWVISQMSGTEIPASRRDAILDKVGLTDRADALVKNYSMGMKQRLGLATALIHDPELLILDEPTNGLDPAGMAEIRQLIRQLATEEGKTILISSHLLHEIEQICNRVLILQHGELRAQGYVAQLLANSDQIEIKIKDLTAAANLLQTLPWVEAVLIETDHLIVTAPSDRAADLTATLAQNNLYLHGMRIQERTLENLFFALTTT